MDEQVKELIEQFPAEISDMFRHIRRIIFDSVSCEPEEKLWSKMPSYYVGESFVRLIPFKNHINIEAKAAVLHKDELTDYAFTPKGMLQIYAKQDIPSEIVKQICTETLERPLPKSEKS